MNRETDKEYNESLLENEYWDDYFYYLVNRGMSSREARRKIKKEQEQRRKRGKQ